MAVRLLDDAPGPNQTFQTLAANVRSRSYFPLPPGERCQAGKDDASDVRGLAAPRKFLIESCFCSPEDPSHYYDAGDQGEDHNHPNEGLHLKGLHN